MQHSWACVYLDFQSTNPGIRLWLSMFFCFFLPTLFAKYLISGLQVLPLFATMTFLIGRYSRLWGDKWAERQNKPTLLMSSMPIFPLDPPKCRNILEKYKQKIQRWTNCSGSSYPSWISFKMTDSGGVKIKWSLRMTLRNRLLIFYCLH